MLITCSSGRRLYVFDYVSSRYTRERRLTRNNLLCFVESCGGVVDDKGFNAGYRVDTPVDIYTIFVYYRFLMLFWSRKFYDNNHDECVSRIAI